MISLPRLLGEDALFRYGDHGEPAYSALELLLRAMRWFDWTTTEHILEAMGIDGEDARDKYHHAIQRGIAYGLIERRHPVSSWRAEYRIRPDADRRGRK